MLLLDVASAEVIHSAHSARHSAEEKAHEGFIHMSCFSAPLTFSLHVASLGFLHSMVVLG